MSLVNLYKGQVKSAQTKVKTSRDARDRKRSSLTAPKRRVSQLQASLRQARSDSQRQGLERQIESKEKEVTRGEEGLGRAEDDLSNAEKTLDTAREKLGKAEEADQKSAERTAKQVQQRGDQQERQEAQRRDREDRERANREASQDAEIEDLRIRASDLGSRLLEAERKKAPPELTVLFLAASPQDEIPLRLDKETRARAIQKRMRATEFRDSIFIEWRLARQIPDLIQDLNETRPHVLHFSGHGNVMELAFEDSRGLAVPLENNQLDGLLAAAPEPIRLVHFNSCNSAAQAELAVRRVELAIGMDATVEDEVAQVFAGQFYNSLGFGLSVQTAFDQAKWQVEVECGRAQEIPRLFHAEDVEPNVVVLVNPD
jgi:hypothetical protein